jgi:hypothetical protein
MNTTHILPAGHVALDAHREPAGRAPTPTSSQCSGDAQSMTAAGGLYPGPAAIWGAIPTHSPLPVRYLPEVTR